MADKTLEIQVKGTGDFSQVKTGTGELTKAKDVVKALAEGSTDAEKQQRALDQALANASSESLENIKQALIEIIAKEVEAGKGAEDFKKELAAIEKIQADKLNKSLGELFENEKKVKGQLVGLVKDLANIKSPADAAAVTINRLGKALKLTATTGVTAGIGFALKQQFDEATASATKTFEAIQSIASTDIQTASLDELNSKISQAEEQLVEIEKSGLLKKALFGEELKKGSEFLEFQIGKLREQKEALTEAQRAAQVYADAQKKIAEETTEANKAIDEQLAVTQKLSRQQDELTNAQAALDLAKVDAAEKAGQISAEEAIRGRAQIRERAEAAKQEQEVARKQAEIDANRKKITANSQAIDQKKKEIEAAKEQHQQTETLENELKALLEENRKLTDEVNKRNAAIKQEIDFTKQVNEIKNKTAKVETNSQLNQAKSDEQKKLAENQERQTDSLKEQLGLERQITNEKQNQSKEVAKATNEAPKTQEELKKIQQDFSKNGKGINPVTRDLATGKLVMRGEGDDPFSLPPDTKPFKDLLGPNPFDLKDGSDAWFNKDKTSPTSPEQQGGSEAAQPAVAAAQQTQTAAEQTATNTQQGFSEIAGALQGLPPAIKSIETAVTAKLQEVLKIANEAKRVAEQAASQIKSMRSTT